MESSQSLVISFLVVIILLLLFSKITVQYHTQPTTQPTAQNSTKSNTVKSNNSKLPQPTKVVASQPTEFNPNPFSNLQEDEYMPEELRQQIRDMEDRFYYNDCGKN
jgi:hypothetical protein